jgi:hypothetical protein
MKDAQVKQYQKDADQHIAEANAKSAEANVKSAEANARSAEAHSTAVKTEHENLLLQTQLNLERDARLVIEKRIAQRGLTVADIGPVLRATFPLGVQPINIVFYKDDAESRILAGNLAATFSEWTIRLFEAPGGNSHQVDVEYDPKDSKATERAKAIFDALRATDKLRMGGPWESLPHEIQGTAPNSYNPAPTATIRIVVGYR